MSTKTYRLSPMFCNDHWSRDCGETDKIAKEGKYCIYVELDAAGYADMLSDAELYSDHTHFDPPAEFYKLAQSARRVVKVLKADGPPTEAPSGQDLAEVMEHAERKQTRMGWCTPGPEAQHDQCRREVYVQQTRQVLECKCECHVS